MRYREHRVKLPEVGSRPAFQGSAFEHTSPSIAQNVHKLINRLFGAITGGPYSQTPLPHHLAVYTMWQ